MPSILPVADLTGRMKWWDPRKCLGFIVRDDTGEDVFMHVRGISDRALREVLQKVGFRLQESGVRISVRFDVSVDPRHPNKPLAINVRMGL